MDSEVKKADVARVRARLARDAARMRELNVTGSANDATDVVRRINEKSDGRENGAGSAGEPIRGR